MENRLKWENDHIVLQHMSGWYFWLCHNQEVFHESAVKCCDPKYKFARLIFYNRQIYSQYVSTQKIHVTVDINE